MVDKERLLVALEAELDYARGSQEQFYDNGFFVTADGFGSIAGVLELAIDYIKNHRHAVCVEIEGGVVVWETYDRNHIDLSVIDRDTEEDEEDIS